MKQVMERSEDRANDEHESRILSTNPTLRTRQPPSVCRVAVPVPFLDLLTYRVPDGVDRPCVGARVLVPLGTRQVDRLRRHGRRRRPHQASRRAISSAVIDTSAYVPPHVVDSRRGSRSTTRPVPAKRFGGDAAGRRAARPAPRARVQDIRVASLTAAGHDSRERAPTPGFSLTDRHREALAVLQRRPDGPAGQPAAEPRHQRRHAPRLQARARRFRQDRVERDPFAPWSRWRRTSRRRSSQDPERRAGGRARASSNGWPRRALSSVALLHGVTGSGKTEVYLRLADRVRAAGRRVLVLVPEIALTPAVASRVPRRVRRSRRHPAQRAVGRRASRPVASHPSGDVDVVVGTRSAVFAPLDRSGPRSSSTRSTTPRTSRRRHRATTGATSRSSRAQPPERSSCSDRRRRRWRAIGMRWTAGTRC